MTDLQEQHSDIVPGMEPARRSVPIQLELRLAQIAKRQALTLVVCAITLAIVGFFFVEFIRLYLSLQDISNSFDPTPVQQLPVDQPGYDPGLGG